MSPITSQFLLRVRSCGDGYAATLQALPTSGHPEDMAGLGAVVCGYGATAPAACVAVIAEAHLPLVPRAPRESHYAC